MTDPQIITAAYEEAVKNAFKPLVDALNTKRKPAEVKQAEADFVAAVTNARKTRDRAIELIST